MIASENWDVAELTCLLTEVISINQVFVKVNVESITSSFFILNFNFNWEISIYISAARALETAVIVSPFALNLVSEHFV
jgi:hypothetical protein